MSDLRGDWLKRNAAQLHESDLPEVLSGLSSQILPSLNDRFFNSTAVMGNHRYVHYVCYTISNPGSILHSTQPLNARIRAPVLVLPGLTVSMGRQMATIQVAVAVFDPTATHVMGQAFDCACRSLHEIGQLDNALKEVIAKRIVELARDGERDPDKLCEHALQTLGFFPGVDVPPKWTSDRDRTPFVSKRKDSSYRSGRSPDWIKSKNPAAPAVKREAEEDWGSVTVDAATGIYKPKGAYRVRRAERPRIRI